jgi:hypothetical protein
MTMSLPPCLCSVTQIAVLGECGTILGFGAWQHFLGMKSHRNRVLHSDQIA